MAGAPFDDIDAMGIKLGGKPDWFRLSPLYKRHLLGTPGWYIDGGAVVIHRTHLPLLPWELQRAAGLLMERSANYWVGPSDFVPKLLQNPTKHEMSLIWQRGQFDKSTAKQGWQLRPYQHPAREFILAHRGTFLGDQMRMGKSCEILAAHDLDRDGAIVVVGPLASRGVWLSWFLRRWPDVKPVVFSGRTFDPELVTRSPVVFVHYDLLWDWQVTIKDLGMVVFDEGHLLANRKSKRSQAAIFLAMQAKRVVIATGTPVWNKPASVYHLVSLLNPGAWGKFFDFGTRYASGMTSAYGFVATGVSNEVEFQQRMREVYFGRKWSDVLDLPPVTRSVELAPLNSPEAAADLVKAAARSRKGTGDRTTVGELARLRRILGLAKVPVAVTAAEAILSRGDPVLVWAYHRDVATKIAAALEPGSTLITGDTPVAKRDKLLDAWRQTKRALVMTIDVGQVAIDLSHTAHCVFAEQDWTPAKVAQAEARPFSKDRPMTATYVVADHPVDIRVVDMILQKCSAAEKFGLNAAEADMSFLKDALDKRRPLLTPELRPLLLDNCHWGDL
jgi:SNF2 family DNA or RNA helicase